MERLATICQATAKAYRRTKAASPKASTLYKLDSRGRLQCSLQVSRKRRPSWANPRCARPAPR
eukprot:4747091-Karenia_brevis.AAC.1